MYTQTFSEVWDMQLDHGRQTDLETLYDDYRKESSLYWRQRIEQAMSKILNESGASRQLRDELIRATRVNDRNRMDYVRAEIRRLEANKYNNNIQL